MGGEVGRVNFPVFNMDIPPPEQAFSFIDDRNGIEQNEKGQEYEKKGNGHYGSHV
jgi:hypothetical protein